MNIEELIAYGQAPEDASQVVEWLEKRGRTFGVFVDGQWVQGERVFSTVNPANGNVLASITQSDESTVGQAVAAAQRALPAWSSMPGTERGRLLYSIARAVQRHSRLFAVLETLDTGKPIRESRDIDIPLVARHFMYHAGWSILSERELNDFEPVGVCGQIIPWNFPLLMLAWKVAPALATGNTVVIKPAETTPLTALLFAEVCAAAGLPAGVLNVVTGDGTTGRLIVEHPDIAKIAFTGSTEVGREIRRVTASRDIKLSLELGGKSPFIVFQDADLDAAVEGVVDSIWLNQGQVCCAGSRLLVQEGVADRFLDKLKKRMATLRVGDPLDKAVDMGALNSPAQLERVLGFVTEAEAEGADVYQSPCELPQGGCYFRPTLVSNTEPASTIAQEEVFGPVLVSMTFRTPAEAVAIANNIRFGLAASIWTQNVDVAHDIAAKVKAGSIWINSANSFDASTEFGGYRESGFGREGGREGLQEYLRPKTPQAASSGMAGFIAPKKSGVDRTHKLYIGGQQVRPDGGTSYQAHGQDFARANRKDVRNAVEAASSAQPGWASMSGYQRAQILFYLAENLSAARSLFLEAGYAVSEFEAALSQVLQFASLADKHDGSVHQGPTRTLVYTRPEPFGVMGITLPESPSLLSLLKSVAAAIAGGNSVVALASETQPHAAVGLYRVMEASDIPAGLVNLLTGLQSELLPHLAGHLGVDAVWHFAASGAETARLESAGNLKPVWIETPDWTAPDGRLWLQKATQIKAVWVPYGA
jgi:aldehyde dehydrogenase (NAD+)